MPNAQREKTSQGSWKHTDKLGESVNLFLTTKSTQRTLRVKFPSQLVVVQKKLEADASFDTALTLTAMVRALSTLKAKPADTTLND